MNLPMLSRARGLGVNLTSARSLSLIPVQPCNTTLFDNDADKGRERKE